MAPVEGSAGSVGPMIREGAGVVATGGTGSCGGVAGAPVCKGGSGHGVTGVPVVGGTPGTGGSIVVGVPGMVGTVPGTLGGDCGTVPGMVGAVPGMVGAARGMAGVVAGVPGAVLGVIGSAPGSVGVLLGRGLVPGIAGASGSVDVVEGAPGMLGVGDVPGTVPCIGWGCVGVIGPCAAAMPGASDSTTASHTTFILQPYFSIEAGRHGQSDICATIPEAGPIALAGTSGCEPSPVNALVACPRVAARKTTYEKPRWS